VPAVSMLNRQVFYLSYEPSEDESCFAEAAGRFSKCANSCSVESDALYMSL
jgi:hypothetical protein